MWKVEKTACLALKVGRCVLFILDGQLEVPWAEVHLYTDYQVHLHLCNAQRCPAGLSHFQAPGCPLQGSSELHFEAHLSESVGVAALAYSREGVWFML